MTVEWNLSDRDYELLSAYLDGGLAAAERSALEQRLNTEPALQAELTALAETVALLNQLPSRRAPRDFTLTPAMIGRGTAPRRGLLYLATSPAFSAVTAAAAVFLVVIGAFLVLQGGNLAMPSQSASAPVAVQPTDGAVTSEGIALSLTPLEETIVQRGMADTNAPSAEAQEQALYAAPLPTQAIAGTLLPLSPAATLTATVPAAMAPAAPSSLAVPSVKASDAGDAAAGALAQPPAISATNIPQTTTPVASVGEAEAANLQPIPAPTMSPQGAIAAANTATASATPPPTPTAQPTASITPAVVVDDFTVEGQTAQTGEDGVNPQDVVVNKQPTPTPAAIPAGIVIVVLGLGLLIVSVVTTLIRRRS